MGQPWPATTWSSRTLPGVNMILIPFTHDRAFNLPTEEFISVQKSSHCSKAAPVKKNISSNFNDGCCSKPATKNICAHVICFVQIQWTTIVPLSILKFLRYFMLSILTWIFSCVTWILKLKFYKWFSNPISFCTKCLRNLGPFYIESYFFI